MATESFENWLRLLAGVDKDLAAWAWGMLTRDSVCSVLRAAVRSAKESTDVEPSLERCWRFVKDPACLTTIERVQIRNTIDCARLHQNLGALIATAGAAVAAARAVNASTEDAAAPQRVCEWLARASRFLSGEWEDGPTPSLPTANFFESPSRLIQKATDQLTSVGMIRAGAARYWADFWFGDSQSPLRTVPLGVKEWGGDGRIVDLRMERVEANELIDHFDSALCPADHALLETLREAQRAAGTGVVWSIQARPEREPKEGVVQPPWDRLLEGRSLGLAAHVAFRLLKEGKPYDETCLLMGQVWGGQIEKVEAESDKLEAAVMTGKIRRVGVAAAADVGRWRTYPGIEIRTIRTIDDAVEYASGLIAQVQLILQGEIDKVVDDAGVRLGRSRHREGDSDRRVQSWEDLRQLHVEVKVARGIRPLLRESEMRLIEQQRSLGDYSGQNRVERERQDLRAEELQDRLPKEKRRQTVAWNSIRTNMKRAVVTGDPGYGKTMLSWLELEENIEALESLKSQTQTIHEIHFSIWMRAGELATVVQSQGAIDAVLTKLTTTYGLNTDGQTWLREQLNLGNGRIVLDALDEVPDSDRKKLDEALRKLPGASRILMTSRLAGYAGVPFLVPKDNEVEVLAFDNRHMRMAIRAWFDADRAQQSDPEREADRMRDRETADALWSHIQEHWIVKEILHCPLLLRLACETAREATKQGQKLLRWETRAELYEKFLHHGIQRFSEKRGLKSEEETRIEDLIRKLKSDDPVVPTLKKMLEQMKAGPEVQREFLRFAADLSLQLWKLDSQLTFWEAEPLGETIAEVRGNYPEFKKRPLLENLKAADILVLASPQKDGNPPLMYTHRTIGEYLVARALAEKLKSGDAPEWSLIDLKGWDPSWRPVFLFLGGILSDSAETVSRLMEVITHPPTDPKFDDDFRHRQTLATEVLAECAAGTLSDPLLQAWVGELTRLVHQQYWENLFNETLPLVPQSETVWRAVGKLDTNTPKQPVITALLERLTDPKETVRSRAAEALSQMVEVVPQDRILAALLEHIADPYPGVRWHAAEALGRMGNASPQDRVLAALVGCLTDPHPGVCTTAAKALGEIGEPAAQDWVLAALLERLADPDEYVCESSVDALGRIGDATAQNRALATLLERLASPDEYVRGKAVDALGRIGEAAAEDRVLSALLGCLDDPTQYVRGKAAEALSRMGDDAIQDRVLAVLLESLTDEFRELLGLRSAEALGRIGEPAAQPWVLATLVARLADPQADVRKSAAEALGRMGKAAAQDGVLAALQEHLADPDQDVRWKAAEALVWMGEDSAQGHVLTALVERVTHPYGHVRENAAEALGRMGKAAAQDWVLTALLEWLRDRDPYVRYCAAKALQRLGEAAAQDRVLAALLERLADPDAIIRTIAAEALRTLFASGIRIFHSAGGSIEVRHVDELSHRTG